MFCANAPLLAEAVADALDELPLPYRFDVQAHEAIRHAPLFEHIARAGIAIYDREMDASESTASVS